MTPPDTNTAPVQEVLPLAAENVSITPTTRAHTVHLEFKKEALEPVLDRYWDQVRGVLHPDLVAKAQRGGFRDVRRDRVVEAAGGLSDFYAPALAETVEKYMETQPRQTLAITNIKCTETLAYYLLDVTAHLEPEVRWLKAVPGIDVPLDVHVPKVAADFAEQLAEESINEAAELTAILAPAAPEAVGADGLVAVVDVDSSIDGQPWEDGRAVAKKWVLDARVFKVPELYTALIGMAQNTTKELTFVLSDKFGDVGGKTVTAKLHLIQLFTAEKAPLNDDLAKSNGYDTLVSYKAMFKSAAEENIARSKAAAFGSAVYAALLDVETVDVDPVPYVWMTEKAKEIYGQARGMVENEDQLIRQFAGIKDSEGKQLVSSKGDALTYLAQQSAQTLITDLVLRSWGLKRGVPGSRKLSDMAEYTKAVRAEIEKVANKIEYDTKEA